MNRTTWIGRVFTAFCLTSFAAYGDEHPAAPPTTLEQWAHGAQLFEGLGSFHREAATNSDAAQAYFDQGMRFIWAFNHDEATRSFAKAAELDPHCAICYWGAALTVGPNYNLPMMAEPRAKVAWEALQQAQANAGHATPVEQALITALASRYQGAQPLDPSNEGPVLVAYARAMQTVAAKYPDDSDVQTLTAEALMNINAWKLWTLDGAPASGTEDIVARLQGVLAKDRLHPGANHYLVHAVEASPHPEDGVAAAEELRGMMPAAGHLEHMPAHIMQRVGRYGDAAEANVKGAAADLDYFARTNPPDYYMAMYTPHNYQFLAFSTMMQGRKADTLDAARKARALVPADMLLGMPGADWSMTELYAAMVRFGLWDEILAEAPPDARLIGLTGGYRYARTVALVAKGRLADARQSLGELQTLAAAATPDAVAGLNAAADTFAVAVLVAQARIADAEHRSDDAVALLAQAVAREDALAYSEPADWFFPVRHLLGAALLRADRPADAEAVYREDLRRNPRNGWALFGLASSLKAQRRDTEARTVQRSFDAAGSTPIPS